MDFKQLAEIFRRARRAALLPKEMLQEGRGMSREHRLGQGHVHVQGKGSLSTWRVENQQTPRRGGLAWRHPGAFMGKKQSCFSCKPFLFNLQYLLPSKTTHPQGHADPPRCCLGGRSSLFKAGHPGMKQGLSCEG